MYSELLEKYRYPITTAILDRGSDGQVLLRDDEGPSEWAMLDLSVGYGAHYTAITAIRSITSYERYTSGEPFFAEETAETLFDSDPFGLNARLEGYVQRAPGWAGPGSQPATALGVSRAKRFISYLHDIGARAPVVTLSADGEINFYWAFDGNIIDLGFDAAGNGSFFARTSDGNRYRSDELPDHTRLPGAIISVLTSTISG